MKKSETGIQMGTYNKNGKDFHFINFIRFVSIVGIFSLHCLILPKNVEFNEFIQSADYPAFYMAWLNLLRFSVISFCLISGYLIGSRIEDEKIGFYVGRIKTMIKPFLVALLVTAVLLYIGSLLSDKPQKFVVVLSGLILHSPFWFIPSQFMSLLVLVMLSYKLSQRNVGIFLFVLLLIFTIVGVYLYPVNHISTIIPFVLVFYYWLGSFARQRNWISRIKSIRLSTLAMVWIACFLMVNFESYFLWKNHYPKMLNNLRLTNQLYAIASILVLVKISDYLKPFRVLDPRSESYGIYLYHWIVIAPVATLLRGMLGEKSIGFSGSVMYSIFCFVASYFFCTVVIKRIKNVRFFQLQTGKAKTNANVYYSLKSTFKYHKAS
jgi:fucose 4-O-acetylase-like acetyltransferase